MSEKVAIVIPVYKNNLSAGEHLSLERCKKILAPYPIIFFCPEGLEADFMAGYTVEYFTPSYFQGIAGYNRLMLSPTFYERFEKYAYILLYQLDALVLTDQLLYWCRQGYDYIGASWIDDERTMWHRFRHARKVRRYANKIRGKQNADAALRLDFLSYKRVGNGGFSLRRTQALKNITLKYATWIEKICEAGIPEEAFFGILVNLYKRKELHIAPYRQGIAFAFEMHPSRAYRLNRYKLPFGCHDFEDWEPEFWQDVLKKIDNPERF